MLDFILYVLCIVVIIIFVIPVTVRIATVAYLEAKKQFTKEEKEDEQEKRS